MGRAVPEGGIPLAVGAVVSNIESLVNIDRALTGKPVTERYLTVAGEVAKPLVMKAPIGLPLSRVIELAGGVTIPNYRILLGGPMMGEITSDLTRTVTKTLSGVIVLPENHCLVTVKTRPPETVRNITRVACCQCTLCTELCPRFLLGHSLHPHKIMRALNSPEMLSEAVMKEAMLCSECGICENFACPMMISPREVNSQIKRALMKQGQRWESKGDPLKASPFKSMRYVPTQRLVERLNIKAYDGHPEFLSEEIHPGSVSVSLQQHLGRPASAVVAEGDRVKKGDLNRRCAGGCIGSPGPCQPDWHGDPGG